MLSQNFLMKRRCTGTPLLTRRLPLPPCPYSEQEHSLLFREASSLNTSRYWTCHTTSELNLCLDSSSLVWKPHEGKRLKIPGRFATRGYDASYARSRWKATRVGALGCVRKPPPSSWSTHKKRDRLRDGGSREAQNASSAAASQLEMH
jgi:hypothetical protein